MAKKGKQGSVTPDQIRHCKSILDKAKDECKDINDSANETVEAFSNSGGHKTALKNAVKFSRLEPDEFLAHWRALEHYCDVLGPFDQQDMLETTPRRFEAGSAVN